MTDRKKRPDATAMTDAFLQNLTRMKDPAKGKPRRDIYDLHQRGLILRATPSGTLSWYASYQVKGSGKATMERLGSYPAISRAEARQLVTEARDKARDGISPKALKEESVKAEKDALALRETDRERNRFGEVVRKHLEAKASNRSIGETRAMLETFFGDWFDLDIRDIKRADIEARLKQIGSRQIKGPKGKKMGGPVRREGALAQIRAVMRAHEVREADLSGYRAPIFRELASLRPADIERDRFLTDEEIAALWEATDNWETLSDGSQFSGIVRLLLLSGQRRLEVANIQRGEIGKDGVWRLPRARNKVRDQHAIPLSKTMLDIISAQPMIMVMDGDKLRASDWVFTNTGTSGYSGFSKGKAALDVAMLKALKRRASERGEDTEGVTLEPWRLHDLRRTARTLGERVGVADTLMERLLGHRQRGIQGTYAKFQYIEEKRLALGKLEAEIMRIVKVQPPDNVVPLPDAKRRAKSSG